MKLKVILFVLSLLVIFAFYSENANAYYQTAPATNCYYGASCLTEIPPPYTDNPEEQCPAFFATYLNGYPTCTYGPICCGSDTYCTAIFAGSIYPVPGTCTSETCKYKNQQDCTGGRICGSSGCVCPTEKPVWDASSTKCVECLSDPDCKDPARPICDVPNRICRAPIICECGDKTRCGSCSSATVGQYCEDVGGVGVLKPSLKCPLCQKYNYAGEATGTGSHPKAPEVCYDTVVNGKFTNYVVEGCKSSGSVNEQVCEDTNNNGQPDKCVSSPTVCSSSDSCFTQTYAVDLITGGGTQNLNFGYCGNSPIPKSESNALPAPCGGNPVCGSVCAGQCVPGEPPKKYDASCNKVDACSQCGCPPSTYVPGSYSACGTTVQSTGSQIACNNVPASPSFGTCSYSSPPGAAGEIPDCPVNSPPGEYNKTYTVKGIFLLSGNSGGTFSGYNFTGSAWQANAQIASGASVASYSSPAIFFNNSEYYLISGKGDGTFSGFNWTETGWASAPAIASGLTDVGDNSKPSIFYMDGNWNIIAGNAIGQFSGFTFTGSS